ncbi:hypothetical protein [uncultured Tateyamaria sp.]|uniref:hypothetical protein n=1 Tax=uncultured Tateyamaria sp. TaxID=455651 RepID=UPI00262090E7|nr:hypothetical protein [uncultured Tateyamaria sp.]
MPFEDLSPAQQTFVDRYLKHSLFSKKSDNRKVEHYELFLQLEQDFIDLYNLVPDGTPGRAATNALRDAAIAAKNEGKFKKAHAGIEKALADLRVIDAALTDRRQTLLRQTNALVMDPNAQANDIAFFNAAQQAARAALAAPRPTPAQFDTAEEEFAKALRISLRAGELGDLAARFPAAAVAAQTSFENMRAITGGGEITDERIAAAGQAQVDAETEIARLELEVERIRRLGGRSQAEIAANDALATQAQQGIVAARQALTDARALEKALKGTRMLEDALENGPLSGKSGARKMPNNAIAALIAGFEVDPELTSKTIAIANDALDPLAVANAIPMISAQIENGFADQHGNTLDGLNTESYALSLLETGGTCGPAYFARLDDYVRLGGLVAANPLREGMHDSKVAKVQKRAVGAAEGLIDPTTGQLAMGTDRAKLAVGQTLFHPMATGGRGAPAHNKHVLDTLDFLSRPANAQSANNILTGINAPPAGGGQALVQQSLGKTTAVDEEDARVAVLASMLQSVDQGPIGSCFATGPVRQMRMLDPIEAMGKYAQVASTGELTDASGHRTPVLTNLPPDEDPLIRTLEYTLATAIGREDTMWVSKPLKKGVDKATCDYMDALDPVVGATAANDLAVDLEDAINAEFTPMYDPTVQYGATGADGSSDRGGYVLYDSAGNIVATRDDYLDRVEALALNTSGYDPTSDEGKAVIAAVRGPLAARLDAMRHKPWALPRGGYGDDAREGLHGASNWTTCVGEMTAPINSAQDYTDRTTDVVGSLMDRRGITPDNLVQLEVSGIHTMTLTASDPSFVALMGAAGATSADKIENFIAVPGRDFADNDMTAEDAQAVFDKVIDPVQKEYESIAADDTMPSKARSRAKSKLKKLKKNIKKFRPTAPMLPRDVSDATADALKGIGNARYTRDAAQNEMVQKFCDPQVVIADTNWGTGSDHTYFVIAADPLTGEPYMWEKTDPPGTMTRVKSKWLKKEWALVT